MKGYINIKKLKAADKKQMKQRIGDTKQENAKTTKIPKKSAKFSIKASDEEGEEELNGTRHTTAQSWWPRNT